MKVACYTHKQDVYQCLTLALQTHMECAWLSTVSALNVGLVAGGYDALILDLNVAGPADTILAWLKNQRCAGLPVVCLSSDKGAEQVQYALDAGATDFIVDYTNAAEVVARMTAVARHQGSVESPLIELSGFVLDKRSQSISFDGVPIRTPSMLFDLALLFFSAPNSVITTGQIELALWGEDRGAPYRRVGLVIHRLRNRIGLSGSRGLAVSNRFGKGYVLHPVA